MIFLIHFQHDWQKYIDLVFANTSVVLDQNEDRVIVMDLPYLQKLAVVLAETDPLVIGKILNLISLF